MGNHEAVDNAEMRMMKSVDNLKSKFKGIRTGRATPGLVEDIRVDYYGSPTPLGQVANIAIPEPRLIVIRAFESNMLSEIEKAIQKSELGINPSNDGKLIRLEVPQLDEERRNQIARQLKDLMEQGKAAVNSARRDVNKQLDTETKDSKISEDERDRLKKDVDKLKDCYHKDLEGIFAKKEAEIKNI